MKSKTCYSTDNYVNIYKGQRVNQLKMASNSIFFNEPIVYELKESCIFLRHANLDDTKNRINPCNDKANSWFTFTIIVKDEEINLGKYYFEDDSNEDCVIIYYGE